MASIYLCSILFIVGLIFGSLIGLLLANNYFKREVGKIIQEMEDEKEGSTHQTQYDMLNAIIVQLKKLL